MPGVPLQNRLVIRKTRRPPSSLRTNMLIADLRSVQRTYVTSYYTNSMNTLKQKWENFLPRLDVFVFNNYGFVVTIVIFHCIESCSLLPLGKICRALVQIPVMI